MSLAGFLIGRGLGRPLYPSAGRQFCGSGINRVFTQQFHGQSFRRSTLWGLGLARRQIRLFTGYTGRLGGGGGGGGAAAAARVGSFPSRLYGRTTFPLSAISSLPFTPIMSSLKQGEFVGSLDCGTTYVSLHFARGHSMTRHWFLVAPSASLSSTNTRTLSLSTSSSSPNTIPILGTFSRS